MLLGWVNSASIQEDLPLKSRADTTSAFVQDDWKATRTLTLNLGLRWDFDFPRREVFDNRQSSFDRATINPVSGTPGVVTFSGRNGVSDDATRKDWNNFGPRVGFAWQPHENWVIRGGGGILYLGQFTNNVTFDPALGFSKLASFTSPDSRSAAFLLRSGFPAASVPTEAELTPGFGAVPVGQAATTAVSFIEPGRRNGYLESFSFNVQRRLSANWVLEAGYLANLGHKLPGASSENINQVPPQLMPPQRTGAPPVSSIQQCGCTCSGHWELQLSRF